jgi:hypothetical protein
LFHFNPKEKLHEAADEITPQLKIENKPLTEILKRLYYPETSYAWNYIPLEILGQIYERFLGKVIVVKGKKAEVNPKPEVREAGGVFYTPSYIVDSIVEQTVGPLLKDKTPQNAAKLKIVDPACGSGSFLLGAYTYLLNWHLDWYQNNDPTSHAKKKNPPIFEAQSADPTAKGPVYRLTSNERKRILRDNIFGVDIDRQAVEVTKLSLLLKVLEGETNESITNTLKLFHERALPDLGDNIKCGNSLVGSDFYEEHAPGTLSDEDEKRVNVFDWKKEFPAIFKSGGFDAVIGNPPYVRIQAMKKWAPQETEFLKTAYESASQGNYDLYVVFVEKALALLNANGRMGYILPHKFFNAQYGASLRQLIASGFHLNNVVHFGHQQVFADATTYTCLLFLTKKTNKTVSIAKVDDLYEWHAKGTAATGTVNTATLSGTEWNFAIGEDAALFEKLSQMPVKLGDVAHVYQGLVTGVDGVFALKVISKHGSVTKVFSKALGKEFKIESSILKPLLKGAEIQRYGVGQIEHTVLFPYKVKDKKMVPLSQNNLKTTFPLAWAYLNAARPTLEDRENGKWKRITEWWQFGRNQNIAEMTKPKLLSQVLSKRGTFAFDDKGTYCFVGGATAGGYGIRLKDTQPYRHEYLLGILNSPITTFFVSKVGSGFRGGFFAFGKGSLFNFPIRAIDFSDKSDVARHDKMVQLVKVMLKLNQELRAATLGSERQRLERRIAATDRQIGALVYELYGLSDEEIALLEAASP